MHSDKAAKTETKRKGNLSRSIQESNDSGKTGLSYSYPSFNISLTCNGGPSNHWQGHHAQEVANGLRGLHWAHQFKCDGGHDGDEEAIAKAQEKADNDEASEAPTQGNHHGHQAQEQEGDDLEKQGPEVGHVMLAIQDHIANHTFFRVSFLPFKKWGSRVSTERAVGLNSYLCPF